MAGKIMQAKFSEEQLTAMLSEVLEGQAIEVLQELIEGDRAVPKPRYGYLTKSRKATPRPKEVDDREENMDEDMPRDDDSDTTEQATNLAKVLLPFPNEELVKDYNERPARVSFVTREEVKPKPITKYATRMDVKFKLKPSNSPEQELLDQFTSWFIKAKSVDKDLVVYPYSKKDREDSAVKSITKPAEIPRTIEKLRMYCTRCWANAAGGDAHGSMYIGSKLPFTKLLDELTQHLKDTKSGMYAAGLQVEKTSVLGWLMMSTDKMSLQSLREEIKEITGVNVGLRWRVIMLPEKGKIAPENRVMAIHMEIDKLRYLVDYPPLHSLYRAQRTTGFPLGVRMRLVPQADKANSRSTIFLMDNFRNFQKKFAMNVASLRTTDIVGVDAAISGTEVTLRNMIMKLKSSSDPDHSLVHSVDRAFRGQAYYFTYIKEFEEEVRTAVPGLLLRFREQVPSASWSKLNRCFTPECQERMKMSKWDKVKQEVIAQEDVLTQELAMVLGLGGVDNDYCRFEFDLIAAQQLGIIPDRTAAAAQEPMIHMDEEANSIETMGTMGTAFTAGTNPTPLDWAQKNSDGTFVQERWKPKTTEDDSIGLAMEDITIQMDTSEDDDEQGEEPKAKNTRLQWKDTNMQGMTNAEATKVIVRNALTTDEGAALLLARLSYNTEHMEKWGKLPETTTQSKGHMDAASTTNGEAGDDTDSAASGSTL